MTKTKIRAAGTIILEYERLYISGGNNIKFAAEIQNRIIRSLAFFSFNDYIIKKIMQEEGKLLFLLFEKCIKLSLVLIDEIYYLHAAGSQPATSSF